ncbi:MAG: thiamine phosphate synthase [candidate division WOR-3 bacterium]
MLNAKSYDRLLDVNFNRFFEALKVLEDIIRFYLADREALTYIRKLKHTLYPYLQSLRVKLLLARESQKDLGRAQKFDFPQASSNYFSAQQLLKTNFSRAEEAARILEELLRYQHKKLSGLFKTIRFSLYDLEKNLFKKLIVTFDPTLYVVLDIPTIGRKNLKIITEACSKAGATIIQLRESKGTPTKIWLTDAVIVKKALNNFPNIRFIINDRVDIALAVDADGVHLGYDDMPIELARKILGENKIIGATTRNLTQALAAENASANYIAVGSIFPSPTKPAAPVVGLKTLKEISQKVHLPVVAIGGINADNIRQVFDNGARGVAVISAILGNIDFTAPNFVAKIKKNLRVLKNQIG